VKPIAVIIKRFLCHSTAAIRECVARGIGVSILPRVALTEKTAAGSLKILPLSGDELEVACLMIWHREKWLSSSLRSFMDLARDELKKAYQGSITDE